MDTPKELAIDAEDFTEFIMALQQECGITIPNSAIEEFTTPRRIIDFVLARVPVIPVSYCLTQRSFYRIRQALCAELGYARRSVRPGARLDELIPLPHRQANWQRLRAALGASDWPGLARSCQLVLWLMLLAVGVWAATFILSGNLLVAIATMVVTGVTGTLMTRPLARDLPARSTTIADLARLLVIKNPQLFLDDPGQWPRERVRLVVRELIAEELGHDDFTDDSRFTLQPSAFGVG